MGKTPGKRPAKAEKALEGEVLTGGGTGGRQPRRIDLATLRDVRAELACLYRAMDAGRIESADGSRRAYVLRTIADVIEAAELEKRIEELESRPGTALPALASR